MKKLAEGFYWVLTRDNKWIVAEYSLNHFWLCGAETSFEQQDFKEIGLRVERNDEVK